MVEKTVTCVSSGSARVIARKLGARAKKKVGGRRKGKQIMVDA